MARLAQGRDSGAVTMILRQLQPAWLIASILCGSPGTSPPGSEQAGPFKECKWAARTSAAQHMVYGSAVWLSKWSQDGDVSQRHFYITGYALFLASYVVFNFVFWSIFVVGTLRAAIWFHQQLLNGIMRSPLSFFDTTPMGRIINRFSRDVESVDKEIPINANMTMCNIVWGMQLLILICIMSPYFTIVVVMAVLLFASVTIVSLPAFRQVQRLRSVTRSPILTHISESIAGVVSVRAFGVTKQFINALERCVDVNINCCYHSISLDWKHIICQSSARGVSTSTVFGDAQDNAWRAEAHVTSANGGSSFGCPTFPEHGPIEGSCELWLQPGQHTC
ncbi:hypothetical protein HPB51_013005 [Rhipicephalus microplus]|uniref:ABC transmembrane type-1 domain-containing protein n=1 Tax=Rhipicephalus microplus TaxID=6941 RepID=A0A9J6F2I6_RHIMP|nr:hypothetical protein HPB51_013005 [Rhipicephalus microplus]